MPSRPSIALLGAVLVSAAAAGPVRADELRGIEARPSALGGRLVQDAGASGGAAVRIPLGRRGRGWLVGLTETDALRLRVSGCRGRFRLRVDEGRWRTVRPTTDGDGVLQVALPARAATSRLWFARAAGRRACGGLTVDRVDVVAPPVLLAAAVRGDLLDAVPGYRSAFLRTFGGLTPENGQKMDVLQPTWGSYAWGASDRLVRFANEQRLPVRGHPLVYWDQLPRWITQPWVPWTRDELRGVLRGHVYTTTRRYRGRIDRWDVVNEVLDWTGRRRPSVWQNVIGDGYVEDAFRAAHAGDPGARLVYNETGIEFPSPQQDAAVRLVADLRSRGVPIDGVGLQGHLDVDGPPSSEDLDAVISRFAALGVGVEFTEVDVSLPGRPTTDVLARQAAAYATVADACWRHVACDRMTVWGIGDDHGWRGRDARALVLDSRYHGKPALTAVREGLAGGGRLVEQSPAARVAPAH